VQTWNLQQGLLVVSEGKGTEEEGVTTVPALLTERLRLRPFTLADAPVVQALAADERVAALTLNIPHPYPPGAAEEWIATHAPAASAGTAYTFAIERATDNALLGAIGMHPNARHRRAEIGYWLGVPYWGQHYMSEAARRVVTFGFDILALNRVQATCLPRNLASAGVMQNAGMTYEGRLRAYICKQGTAEDIEMYAILRDEWETKGVRA
jgi:[ribosomal protein S5]-alanine N-acetyltransferase